MPSQSSPWSPPLWCFKGGCRGQAWGNQTGCDSHSGNVGMAVGLNLCEIDGQDSVCVLYACVCSCAPLPVHRGTSMFSWCLECNAENKCREKLRCFHLSHAVESGKTTPGYLTFSPSLSFWVCSGEVSCGGESVRTHQSGRLGTLWENTQTWPISLHFNNLSLSFSL